MNSDKQQETMNSEIEPLIQQIQQGDIDQYRFIIARYQKQIYIYCYCLLKNHEQAEDAVQEIFIKGFQNIHQYSSISTFGAWLYKIAYHHCINVSKKKARDWKLLQQIQHICSLKSNLPVHHGVDATDLLDLLTSEEKHILLLRAVEDYSFHEIADVMNLKSSTVRKKYERLRKKLIRHTDNGGYLHDHSLKPTRS